MPASPEGIGWPCCRGFSRTPSDVASAVAGGHEIPTDCRLVMSSQLPRPFDRSLSELQALLLESDTLHHFLDRLAALTAQALPEGSSWCHGPAELPGGHPGR